MAILTDPLRLVVGDKVGQAAGPGARAEDRRRPAAPLPAPVRDPGRADRPGLAARRRARDRAGRDGQGDHPADAQPAGLDLRGDRHRRARAADPDVLRPGRPGLAGGAAHARHARPVLRPGVHLPRQAPARPPGVRAAGRGRRRGHRAAEYAAEIIPVYPAASEIASWQIAGAVRIVLDVLDVEDPMPRAIRDRHGLRGLADALRGIHRPVDRADVQRSTKRLKWDEAFLLQIVLAQRRLAATAYSATPRPRVPGGLLDAFDAAAAVRPDRRAGAGRHADRRRAGAPTTRCTGCCRARSARARR